MARTNHRPSGPAPTTLERNVLKLRALETVLVLFYMEDLKRHVIKSIELTDALSGQSSQLAGGKAKGGEGRKLEVAREVLVRKGAITQPDSDRLKELVDYRNTVGHQLHQITMDVGAYSHLIRLDRNGQHLHTAYEHAAAQDAADLRDRVKQGMMGKFISPASFDSLSFDAAERTYIAEIRRLKAKIKKEAEAFVRTVAEANRCMQSIPREVLDSARPNHEGHKKRNGNLTASGIACINALFQAKSTPFVAAHMMRISLATSNRWHRRWQEQQSHIQ